MQGTQDKVTGTASSRPVAGASPADVRTQWQSIARRFGSATVLATADWDASQWTNKQHIAFHLATAVDVLYVESLALREPRLTISDAKRAMRRLSAVRRGGTPRVGKPRPARLEVVAPVVIPFHRHAWVRRLNRTLLDRQLGERLRPLATPRLLWSYAPIAIDLIDLTEFDVIVYHSVDDYATQPGMDPRLFDAVEGRFVARADLVFATSPALAARWSLVNSRTHLVGNVADYQHFAAALGSARPSELSDVDTPLAMFVGALSDYKIDWELMRGVAMALPDVTFAFIGSQGSEGRNSGAGLLASLDNCRFLGHRDYEDLPSYLAASDVGLIPYRRTEHTDSIFPMKVFEYLAAGLPVVTTDLPATRSVAGDVLRRATTAEGFAHAIREVLRRPPSPEELARHAQTRTWDTLLLDAMRQLESVVTPRLD
jgi:glycosyltransferase involved in cell wall biosynthesis